MIIFNVVNLASGSYPLKSESVLGSDLQPSTRHLQNYVEK